MPDGPAVVSWWFVEVHGAGAERQSCARAIAVDADGKRVPKLERQAEELFVRPTRGPALDVDQRKKLLAEAVEPMLQRDLEHRGLIHDRGGYSAKLIGWIEVV